MVGGLLPLLASRRLDEWRTAIRPPISQSAYLPKFLIAKQAAIGMKCVQLIGADAREVVAKGERRERSGRA
jgi:hypothetical protein